MTVQIAKRRPDPFDGSSGARLSRMGLLTGAGDVDEAAMQVFIHIFAASFFDDLCDTYESLEAISKITAAFCELEERNDPQRIFLLLSLQLVGGKSIGRPHVVCGLGGNCNMQYLFRPRLGAAAGRMVYGFLGHCDCSHVPKYGGQLGYSVGVQRGHVQTAYIGPSRLDGEYSQNIRPACRLSLDNNIIVVSGLQQL